MRNLLPEILRLSCIWGIKRADKTRREPASTIHTSASAPHQTAQDVQLWMPAFPIRLLPQKSDRRQTTAGTTTKGEVLLKRRHHENGCDSLINFRSRRERREDPFSQARVFNVLLNQSGHLEGELAPVKTLQ